MARCIHAAAFSGMLLLCGCTIVTEEIGTALPQHASPAVAATSNEILESFGPPAMVSALGDGYAFLYEHTLITEKQLGLSVNYLWLRYFKFSIGSAEADRDLLVFTFDQSGRLTGEGRKAYSEKLGDGNSIQLIITVMSVVDSGDLTETPVSMQWGGALLQSRLTESLNYQNSPLSGGNGLEISGTPTGAGQRTLEASSFPIVDLNSF